MARIIGGVKSTVPDSPFTGGNQSVADLKAIAENILLGNPGSTVGGLFSLNEYYDFKKANAWPGSGNTDNITPVNGGTLTVNSQNHGSYSYTRKEGNQTISSWNASDWFVNNSNSHGQFIIVNGNLTLNSGITMNQSGVGNKLFTFVYVNGDLTINGTVDWNYNGAKSHGSIGSNDLRITSDTRGGASNPYIPGIGGAGGARLSNHPGGATGSAGTNGGTGGGGTAGGWGGNAHTGPGGNGTCYTGGSGSGGARDAGNSGPGGNGGTYIGWAGQSPEGGNGHGTNSCGAVIIFFVTGTFSGSGSITAIGGQGSYGRLGSGGSGGGGSITIICNSNSSSITPNAAGGPGNHRGGGGGAGTARILAG